MKALIFLLTLSSVCFSQTIKVTNKNRDRDAMLGNGLISTGIGGISSAMGAGGAKGDDSVDGSRTIGFYSMAIGIMQLGGVAVTALSKYFDSMDEKEKRASLKTYRHLKKVAKVSNKNISMIPLDMKWFKYLELVECIDCSMQKVSEVGAQLFNASNSVQSENNRALKKVLSFFEKQI